MLEIRLFFKNYRDKQRSQKETDKNVFKFNELKNFVLHDIRTLRVLIFYLKEQKKAISGERLSVLSAASVVKKLTQPKPSP